MKIVINTTKHLLQRLVIFTVFVLVLIAVIAYARGYRFNFREGTISSTGIISVNSSPRPAKVYINGVLQGATDTNLTLPYGKYTVEVKKEGYSSWKKEVSLKGELVMSLNALLFSRNPSLTPLTNLGISKAVSVGNTDKIILLTTTGDTEKDGIYLFEPSSQPLTIFPPLKLLMLQSLLPVELDMNTAEFEFDPNYRQAIVTFQYAQTETDQDEDVPPESISYLVTLDNQNVELFDITNSRDTILARWETEKNKELLKIVETLPKKLQKTATESFYIVSLSPDEKKVMYVAKADDSLPIVLDPPLIGANQTPEVRNIKKGNLYIYDKKEDKNFHIPLAHEIVIPTPTPSVAASVRTNDTVTPSVSPTPALAQVLNAQLVHNIQQTVLWYPTSDYIAVKEDKQIVIMQYDGENKEVVYAGPFNPAYFGISPDWNLMVVINLNPQNNQYGDLYSVGIR